MINNIFGSYQEKDFKMQMAQIMNKNPNELPKERNLLVHEDTRSEILNEGGESLGSRFKL